MDHHHQNCNIEKSSILLNWCKQHSQQHYDRATLRELATQMDSLVLFLTTLFNVSITTNENAVVSIFRNIHEKIPEIFANPIDNINNEIELIQYVQEQHNIYYLYYFILKNHSLSFTHYVNHHCYRSLSTFQNIHDVSDALYSWASYILKDYIAASVIPPTSSSIYKRILCILHYHEPHLVPDLFRLLKAQTPDTQDLDDFVITILKDRYNISPLLPFDSMQAEEEYELVQLQLMVDLISTLPYPTESESHMKRHQDLECFKANPMLHLRHKEEGEIQADEQQQQIVVFADHVDQESDMTPNTTTTITSTTTTATFTTQQLKLTKTTVYRYSDGTEIPQDLEEFERKAAQLVERMNQIQHQLSFIIPTTATQTTSSASYSPSSGTIVSFDTNQTDFFSHCSTTSGATAATTISEASSTRCSLDEQVLLDDHHHQAQLKPLIPPLNTTSPSVALTTEETSIPYEKNFKQLQGEFQSLCDHDLHELLHIYLPEQHQRFSPEVKDHPKLAWRKNQLLELQTQLSHAFQRSEVVLAHFKRAFSFSQLCQSIRQDLELVQHKMVKSITTYQDIKELQSKVENTTHMIHALKSDYRDLLAAPPQRPIASTSSSREGDVAAPSTIDIMEDKDTAIVVAPSSPSNVNAVSTYNSQLELIENKNALVCSWVEEVRIWFTEAERIRQWIEKRLEQLNSPTYTSVLPEDPLSEDLVNLANKQEIEVELSTLQHKLLLLNESHGQLEKEIEQFDNEDMTRLRSHVKSLTATPITKNLDGSNDDEEEENVKKPQQYQKDLSPADTTTIEITLTTLMTLDQLTQVLNKKSHALRILTQRVTWEQEWMKTMQWLEDIEHSLNEFLDKEARWRPDFLCSASITITAKEGLKEDTNQYYHQQKALLIQHLLSLENKVASFDQGQFTKTVDLYQELDTMASVDLPSHLETRQELSEQYLENLMKRLAFARQVVEQRLMMMDFCHQTEEITKDAKLLQENLMGALMVRQTSNTHKNGSTATTTAFGPLVHGIHERIIQLVTVTAAKVPYPVPAIAASSILQEDSIQNEKEEANRANEKVHHVVSQSKNTLIDLSEQLDRLLQTYHHILQLQARTHHYLNDANSLCQWASEQIDILANSSQEMMMFQQERDADTLTIDDLCRFENTLNRVLNELHSSNHSGATGKEDEVVELLTCIQQVLEETGHLQKSSLLSSIGGGVLKETNSIIDRDRLQDVSRQLEKRFDNLQQFLEEQKAQLDQLRQHLQSGHQYMEQAQLLLAFIHKTRQAIPGQKQLYGFMTGEKEEQDANRLESLETSLNFLRDQFQSQRSAYSRIVGGAAAAHPTVNPSDHKQTSDMKTIQDDVQKEWNALSKDIDQFQQFTDSVRDWFERQRRLSSVEQEYLNNLNDDINQLTENFSKRDNDTSLLLLTSVEDKIGKATPLLKAIEEEIVTALQYDAQTKSDPLQIANYSCARDRCAGLMKQLNHAVERLNILKTDASQAIVLADFLKKLDDACNRVKEQAASVSNRVNNVDQNFAILSMEEMKTRADMMQKLNQQAEEESRQLKEMVDAMSREADKIVFNPASSNGYDHAIQCSKSRDCLDSALNRLRESYDQLLNHIETEKKQATFTRKIYTHTKAAHDLQHWMACCLKAIEELPTDVAIYEEQDLISEINNIEQKMNEVKPTIQTFVEMPARIFSGKDDCQGLQLDIEKVFSAVNERQSTTLGKWDHLKAQHSRTRLAVEQSKQTLEFGKKAKIYQSRIRELHNQADAARIIKYTTSLQQQSLENDDDIVTAVLKYPSIWMSTEHRLNSAKVKLEMIQQIIQTQLQPAIDELFERCPTVSTFKQQKEDLSMALDAVVGIVKAKQHGIEEAEKMSGFFTVIEEIDVLLSALSEVIVRATPDQQQNHGDDNISILFGNRFDSDRYYRPVDIQALLIDLDTRYRYYEPKINDLFVEADEVMRKQNTEKDGRVIACVQQLRDRWSQLKKDATNKKNHLLSLANETDNSKVAPPFPLESRSVMTTSDRTSATPVTGSILQDRGRKVIMNNKGHQIPLPLKEPPKPKLIQSTVPRLMTGCTRKRTQTTTTPVPFALSATAARADARKRLSAMAALPSQSTTTATTEKERAARRVNARQTAAQKHRDRITGTIPHAVAKKIPATTAATTTSETYVSDPKNDLDVALGDIVNDSPYKIQVKMVPGEVGKYWFGDVNPKLAYCRILRSRMVMVRVGGGWVELSQFLRDHALLEGGQFVSSTSNKRASLPPLSSAVVREGFLNTTAVAGTTGNSPYRKSMLANNAINIRGGGCLSRTGTRKESDGDAFIESQSTAYQQQQTAQFHRRGVSPISYGHGIKTGNKFLVTDGEGNRVEVKMTKAKNKDTKFVTPFKL